MWIKASALGNCDTILSLLPWNVQVLLGSRNYYCFLIILQFLLKNKNKKRKNLRQLTREVMQRASNLCWLNIQLDYNLLLNNLSMNNAREISLTYNSARRCVWSMQWKICKADIFCRIYSFGGGLWSINCLSHFSFSQQNASLDEIFSTEIKVRQ